MKKILILAANPKGTSRLRLDEEVREIEEGLNRAKYRVNFSIQSKWAVRPRDIRRAMLDFEPSIVHFCGHGEGAEGIVLEDKAGHTKLASAEALAGLFELFADTVGCVLLNACHSEEQAKAIVRYIDYVIGMNRTIGDKTAIEFAVGFYDALGAGKSIDFAYNVGCIAIQLEGISEYDTPVLMKKSELQLQTLQQVQNEKERFIKEQSEKLSQVTNNKRLFEEHLIRDSKNKEAANWLKNHIKVLSINAGEHVLRNFPQKLSQKEVDWFYMEIERYLDLTCGCLLTEDRDLIDEPRRFKISLSASLYLEAFKYVRNRIPKHLAYESIATLEELFDYLIIRFS